MNNFRIIFRNITNFFQQIVAGVKKVFTFALPITTRTSNTNVQKCGRGNKNEIISLRATYRLPSSLKD
jgi:hypothetical protein